MKSEQEMHLEKQSLLEKEHDLKHEKINKLQSELQETQKNHELTHKTKESIVNEN